MGNPKAFCALRKKASESFATRSVLVPTARTESTGMPRSRSPKRLSEVNARS